MLSLFDTEDASHDHNVDEQSEQPQAIVPDNSFILPIYGHTAQENMLLSAIMADQLPHALIFTGPEGIGKSSFAFRFARFLLRSSHSQDQGGLFGDPSPSYPQNFDIPPDDPGARRIAARSHPDFLYIERDFDTDKGRYKPSLNINQIRLIPAFLQMSSSQQNGARVVIIDDAHTMTHEAQNALLKILEEPPPRVVIILISHHLSPFLPTIVSRCRKMAFTPLSAADMIRVMNDRAAPALSPLVMAMAAGRPGKAFALLENDVDGIWQKMTAIMEKSPDIDSVAVHAIAEWLGTPDQDSLFRTFVTIWKFITDSLPLIKAGAMDGHWLARHAPWQKWLIECDMQKLLQNARDHAQHWDLTLDSALDRKSAILLAFEKMKHYDKN